MKPELQLIELAKLDGWTNIESVPHLAEEKFQFVGTDPSDPYCFISLKAGEQPPKKYLKPYLTSRDAIIPLVEKLITTPELERVFNYALYDLLPREVSEVNAMTYVMAIKAKPAQIAEALLRTFGKWIED